MTEENLDVFNEEQETSTEESTQVETTEEVPAAETATTEEAEGESSEKQGENTAEPPAAEDTKSDKSEKMIPEHRFKAALKDVTEKLQEAQQKIAAMEAKPAPDRASDPDGYDRYMRIETSKAIMRDAFPDYDEKIIHFQEMAKVNPVLNDVVANHQAPAKMAYDLAKRDLEIQELSKTKDSDEWKEFQEWKSKQKKEATSGSADTAAQLKAGNKAVEVAAKVPNLNRTATSVSSKEKPSSNEDDDLFKGHFSVRA